MLSTNNLAIIYIDISAVSSSQNSADSWLAKQRVSQLISNSIEAINKHGGIVTQTFDEAVLGTFIKPTAALNTAEQIMAVQVNMLHEETVATPTGGVQVNLKIALNFGKMLVAAGNIAGDELNETIQLAAKARLGTIIYTDKFHNKLKKKPELEPKNIGKVHLDMLAKDIESYELDYFKGVPLDQEPSDNNMEAKNNDQPVAQIQEVHYTPENFTEVVDENDMEVTTFYQEKQNEVLILTLDGKTFKMGKELPLLSFGRSPSNNITLPVPYISRKHLEIEYRDEKFFMVNKGSNGSYIKPSNASEEIHCTSQNQLTGSGKISLGCSVKKNELFLITYEIRQE